MIIENAEKAAKEQGHNLVTVELVKMLQAKQAAGG